MHNTSKLVDNSGQGCFISSIKKYSSKEEAVLARKEKMKQYLKKSRFKKISPQTKTPLVKGENVFKPPRQKSYL